MKKKVCRACRLFVEGEICPLCKKSSFSTTWQGHAIILDANRSEIASKMGFEVKGDYVVKVR